MKSTTFGILTCILCTATLIRSQEFSASDSLNSFGINLLGETNRQAGDLLNVALSTYTVWTLMAVISEGSKENTARQFESTLKIPSNKVPLRSGFQNLSRILLTKSDGVTLELDTAIFTNKEVVVNQTFEDISKRYYGLSVSPINFRNPSRAAEIINKYVAQVTRNRIPTFVSSGDVMYAQVFLTSVLYFKGTWKMPFTKTATESFYDEKNNKIGDVEMMFRIGVFPYSRMEELNSYAVELPYGSDRQMSMIVILPFKGESVSGVLNLMSRMPFSSIIKTLEDSEHQYIDDDVHVYLPKFKISSDFNLNIVLSKIGIKDAFDIDKANLLGMFDQYLYISRLIQKAEIEVNEEGTVATAAAGASFANKSPPPKFRANRPFLYFIINKPSRSIIFAGKVSNPNTLK